MATVEFKDGTVIMFKGDPTPQEIEEAYERGGAKQRAELTEKVAVATGRMPYTQRVMQAPQRVEQMISQRPDAWQALQKELAFQQQQVGVPQGQTPTIPQSLRGVFKDPMTPLVTGLKTAGAGFQRGVSFLTSPIVAAQEGRWGDIPRDVWDAVMGRRNVEGGDIARLTGIPDPYAAAIGLASEAYLTNKLLSFRAPKVLQDTTSKITSAVQRFGRIKAKGFIRAMTGMTDEATEFTVKEGGHKIFLKKYIPVKEWQDKFLNKIRGGIEKIKDPNVKTWAEKTFGFSRKYAPKAVDPMIPYKQTLKTQEGLQVLFKNAIKEYGDDMNAIIDDVATKFPDGKIPIGDLSSSLTRILQQKGIIDSTGELSAMFRNPTPMQLELINQNKELLNLARGRGSITIKDYLKVRKGFLKKLTAGAKSGKTSFNSDDHMIMELVNELDDVIPKDISEDVANMQLKYKNWRQVFNPANERFKPFRGKYYTKGGEDVFNNYGNLDMGTKTLLDDLDDLMPPEYKFSKTLSKYVTDKNTQLLVEEIPAMSAQHKLTDYWQLTRDEHKYLQIIDDSLDESGKFLDDFKRWSATQEALVKQGKQGITPYRLRIAGELGKYGTRQFLRFRQPTAQTLGPMVPPAILRQVSGRNQ